MIIIFHYFLIYKYVFYLYLRQTDGFFAIELKKKVYIRGITKENYENH